MVAAKDGSLTPRPVYTRTADRGPSRRALRAHAADAVVISGAQLVMPGMKAKIRPGKIVPQAIAAPPTPCRFLSAARRPSPAAER